MPCKICQFTWEMRKKKDPNALLELCYKCPETQGKVDDLGPEQIISETGRRRQSITGEFI